jgi:hypothetical protein
LGSIPSQTDGDTTFDFPNTLNLSGLTIFGAHFGNTPDSNPSDPSVKSQDVSAFWLVDLGPDVTHTITITNAQGVSNGQIFATGTPSVPEPATWAMMLLGFGGMGMALRRSRKPALLQIA